MGAAFADLRGWLGFLEDQKQLVRLRGALDLRYDVPRILEEHDGRAAVVFEDVDQRRSSVLVGGTLHSRAQMAQALGVAPTDMLAAYLRALAQPLAPREVQPAQAPVLEVEEPEVRLDLLPAPWHHQRDSGAYITAAVAIVRDPATGVQNWSIHRLQINAARRVGALILPRHLGHIFAVEEAAGRDLPVAFALGLPPGLLLASQAITAFGVDEAGIAGALLREAIPVVRSPRHGIAVPALAEQLFEGRVLAGVREPEGPFGEFPRTYGSRGDKPVVEIDAHYHRHEPYFQTILPASREHMLLGALPREAAVFRAVRHVSPNVRDVALTFAGGCRYHAVIAMAPQIAGEAKNVMLAAFSGANEIKRVVVVDEDIDVGDAADVEWAIANRVQPQRDVTIVAGALGSSLDPSAAAGGVTGKWGIDATIPVGDDRSRYERIRTP
ncbi:UbiD family decarboxylase [bacterium]|nr:MAG: UbiD family decarboxylase [bacterium]